MIANSAKQTPDSSQPPCLGQYHRWEIVEDESKPFFLLEENKKDEIDLKPIHSKIEVGCINQNHHFFLSRPFEKEFYRLAFSNVIFFGERNSRCHLLLQCLLVTLQSFYKMRYKTY